MDVKKLMNNRGVSAAMQLLKKNMMIIITIFVALVFFIIPKSRPILFPENIYNLVNQNAYVIVLAVGMLLCILTGGNIDLSVGSVVAFIGAIAGILMIDKTVNVYAAIVICLLIGLAIGAWQGFWIAYMRIPAFIVTLSGMLMFRGLAQYLNPSSFAFTFTGTNPKEMSELDLNRYRFNQLFGSNLPGGAITVWVIASLIAAAYVGFKIFDRYRKIKKGAIMEHIALFVVNCVLIVGGIVFFAASLANSLYQSAPSVLIILAIIIMFFSYFTSRTVYGRQLYAIGGNEKAAKLSGINTNRMLFFAYVNMAFLCVIVTFICIARQTSAYNAMGTGFEMDAIAACYIGGASAYGGRGTVGGVVIGALLLGIIGNGLSWLGLSQFLILVIKALVLLGAVVFDVISKRRGKTA